MIESQTALHAESIARYSETIQYDEHELPLLIVYGYYTVSQIKRDHFSFRHNFYSCWAILTIFEARNFAYFSASTDVQ